MKNLKVFIGSSEKAKPEAEKIAAYIAERHHTPMPWYDVLNTGNLILTDLEKLANQMDAAIFVFSGDDELHLRDEVYKAVRGNVILEYGLFRGKLGHEKVAFCVSGEPFLKAISDLLGVKYIDLDKEHSVKPELSKWLNDCRKKHLIEDALKYHEGKCLITVPTHTRQIALLPGKTKPEMGRFVRDYDFKLQQDIYDMIRKISNIKADVKMSKSKRDDYKDYYNCEIHIGSPSLSADINRLLKHRFPDFMWFITKEAYSQYFFDDDYKALPHPGVKKTEDDCEWKKTITDDEPQGGSGIYLLGKFYPYKHLHQDHAFLYRFTIDDKKTVHLLFGDASAGRRGAVDYFTHHYEEIVERWGERDYLLAGEVDKYGGFNEATAFKDNLLREQK